MAYVCISHMSVKIMLEEVLGLIHDRYLSGLISFSMQSNNRRLFNPYILYLQIRQFLHPGGCVIQNRQQDKITESLPC